MKTITTLFAAASILFSAMPAHANNDKDAGYCAAYLYMTDAKKNANKAMQAINSGDNKARTQNYASEFVYAINRNLNNKSTMAAYAAQAMSGCRSVRIAL